MTHDHHSVSDRVFGCRGIAHHHAGTRYCPGAEDGRGRGLAQCGARGGLGIVLGCLIWGSAVALGLGALLAASQLAFTALKWAGAIYLVWLGIHLLVKPRSRFEIESDARAGARIVRGGWLKRGLLTNLLNPKVGVFYVSFLPQFVPAHIAPAPYIFLLAALHAVMGLTWFAALILATRPIGRFLKRPATVRVLDRLTGLVFVGFGVKLATARQ